MELINIWLQKSVEMFKKLPTNFDYTLFFKGIFKTIETEHALSISWSIWLLYNTFDIFTGNILIYIIIYLI